MGGYVGLRLWVRQGSAGGGDQPQQRGQWRPLTICVALPPSKLVHVSCRVQQCECVSVCVSLHFLSVYVNGEVQGCVHVCM